MLVRVRAGGILSLGDEFGSGGDLNLHDGTLHLDGGSVELNGGDIHMQNGQLLFESGALRNFQQFDGTCCRRAEGLN